MILALYQRRFILELELADATELAGLCPFLEQFSFQVLFKFADCEPMTLHSVKTHPMHTSDALFLPEVDPLCLKPLGKYSSSILVSSAVMIHAASW